MQHMTLNLPSSSPVKAMSGLARCLALPAENQPQRLPSFPQLERTAVLGFNVPTNLASQYNAANNGSTKIVLCRDAAFPLWHSDVYISNKGYAYHASLLCQDGGDSEVSWNATGELLDADGVGLSTGDFSATGLWPGLSGSSNLAQVPIGMDSALGEAPFMFVPFGMELYAVVSGFAATAASTSFNVVLEEWLQPGRTKDNTYSSGAVQFAATQRGNGWLLQPSVSGSDNGRWFRPSAVSITWASASVAPTLINLSLIVVPPGSSYAPSTTTGGLVSAVTVPDLVALLPAVSCPEFGISREPYRDTRVTAVALLATNVTQVMYKSGTVLAGRVTPERAHFGTVNPETIANLHPAEKAWLPLETGLYTYSPPGVDLAKFNDFTFVPALTFGNLTGYLPLYRLDNNSFVNVAFTSVATTSIQNEMALTLTLHIEFRTSSALFTLAVSGYTLETLHLAQMAMMQSGFFFENPEHKTLVGRIVAGIKKLEPYAAPAIAAVGAVHPPSGKVLSAALSAAKAFSAVASAGKKKANPGPKKLVVKNGPMKMRTTTARASGILGPNKGKKR